MINEIKPTDIDQVRTCGKSLIKMSDSTASMHKALKKYLRLNLYQHERVMSMANKAKETVSFLFNAYMEDTDLLTKELQSSIDKAKDINDKNVVARVVADYIAGMTDRFAFVEADRIKM
jgi:dGTPase